MPITLDEFQQGEARESLDESIVAFLKDHPKIAYSAQELWDEMKKAKKLPEGAPKDNEEEHRGWMVFHVHLETMALQTKVRSKTIYRRGKQAVYYMTK